jgi:hypothetical protein
MQVPTITEEERTSLTKDLTAADSFSREELGAKLKQYGQTSRSLPLPPSSPPLFLSLSASLAFWITSFCRVAAI